MPLPQIIRSRLEEIEFNKAVVLEATAALVPDRVRMKMEEQKGTQWCWAAVAVSFQNHLHTGTRTQCQLVRDLLPNHSGHDCCETGTKPPLSKCNKQAPVQTALAKVNVAVVHKAGTLLFSDVVAHVKAKKLVGCVIHFPSVLLNHFVQIDGVIESTQEFIINDPQRREIRMTRAKMLTNYNNEGGFWRETFLAG